jgi:hypothetical protein
MLASGLQGNFYPQMAAMAAAQENATALVATAKLGSSKINPETNSALVVRSSVRKFNVNGGMLSVAQWTRKTVEENLEWLVKLSKRHFPDEKTIILAYGDGCETLVLLDDRADSMPQDFLKIKKIGVGVSMAKSDEKGDEVKLASQGILQPSDSVWEHLRFEQVDTTGDKKVGKCLFIHTSITVWSDSVEGRRRVLQVSTGAPEKPYFAVGYLPSPMFEQQVLANWKEQGSGHQTIGGDDEPETVITFNPKELILLEKAFDNRMTPRDLKSTTDKCTEEDRRACQSVIKRANDEFVVIGPPKKRQKKAAAAKKVEKAPEKAVVEKKSPAKSPTKPSRKSTASEKVESAKKTKKEDKEADSDDEPISKMKAKVDAKSPTKRASRRSGGSKDSKVKTPKTDSKRGRSSSKSAKSKTKDDSSPKKSARKKSKK